MWNVPTQEELDRVPGLYETEEIPLKDKLIHLHFFIGGCDWFVCETDGELCFGFAVLNGDLDMAEWGYMSLSELKSINIGGIEVDRDLHWKVRPASQVELICKAQGWEKEADNAKDTQLSDRERVPGTDAASGAI